MVNSVSTKYVEANTYASYQDCLENGIKYIRCRQFFTMENFGAGIQAVKQFKVLGLEFSNFFWSPPWITLLFEELKNNAELQELVIGDLWIARVDGLAEEALGSFINHNSSLAMLVLRNTQIEDTSFLASLNLNTHLKSLDLSEHVWNKNKMQLSGLAKGLRENVGLEKLRVAKSKVTDDGAIALARALERNTSLLVLDLEDNKIASKGGVALARTLRKNSTLVELNLSMNWLDGKAVTSLGHSLGVGGNRTLKILGLSHQAKMQGFTNEELLSLERALSVNTVIERIRMRRVIRYPGPEYDASYRIDKLLYERRKKNRIEALHEAEESNVSVPWLRSKLMVVGRGAAGKTNIVRSLLGLPLQKNWNSTVGIDLTQVATMSGADWKETREKDFAKSFIHRLAVERIADTKEEKRQETRQSVVVKAKAKMKRRVDKKKNPPTENARAEDVHEVNNTAIVSQGATFQYEEKLFIAQEESKDAIRMSIWDYGGQTVFYTLHHLFLTQYGVYLVVFNMTKLLDNPEESSEYLSFWLNSIKLHAPNAPVLLVGTFLDMITDTDKPSKESQKGKAKLNEISMLLNDLSGGFDTICAFGDLLYCPTSNKTKAGIQILRWAIERVTQNADFVQTPVSLKWMRALDVLSQSSTKSWTKVTKVKRLLKGIGIEQDEEIESMLGVFHELGVHLYFSASVRLREIVIWKPEWLLKKLSAVIRDKDVHDYNRKKLDQSQLSPDLDYFLQHGIASRDLLEFLWNGKQVDYLVDLMRHLMLLSNWTFSDEEQYLIPSMLSTEKTSTKLQGVQLYLDFAFLPPGIFERLCCLCVDYSSSINNTKQPKLHLGAGVVDLGEKGLLQIDAQVTNKISVTLTEPSQACMILDFFLSMLRKVQHEFMRGGLTWQGWVEHGDTFVKHEVAEAQGLEPWVRKNEIHDTAAIDSLLDL